MANVKKLIGYTTTGKTVYGIIERQADSYLLNDADGAFAIAPADPYVSFTEHATIKGEYILSESRVVWNDGLYKSTVYEQAGGSPVPASDLVVAFQYMYILSDLEVVNDADVGAILIDTAEIGAAGAGLTALGDTRMANLDAAITTRLAPAGTLATVTNLTNAPTVGDLTAAMKLSVNVEADTALTDYDPPTDTEMVAAFTQIKGATWAVTDTLEAIRDKETDIETDTAVIGAAGAGLTALGDTRIANLDAAVSSRLTPAGTLAVCTTNTDMRGTNSAALATALATAQADLDLLTGADGATLATLQALYAPNKIVPDAAGTAAGLHTTTDGLVTTVDTVVDAIKAKTDALPSGIAKNVALSNFELYMVLSSDHVTAATGKTIIGTISKDGGAFAAITNVIAEISNGMYKVNLTQTEMNADVVTLKFTETDCDQRIITVYTT